MNNLKTITNRIISHHELYDLPVFGELWEEILHKSFIDIGEESEWEANRSHSIGKDIVHNNHGRISCKSGVLNIKKGTLKLNGSRTTKHETIKAKIDFLSEKQDDVYYCLSRNKSDWDKNIKKYYLFVFPSSLLDFQNQTWIETFSKKQTVSGWKCNSTKYNAQISKALSDQLWIDIDINCIDSPYIIEIK